MNQRGFTLIEMIISIAIFMIVAVVAVGSLVRIVALNRQAQSLQSSVNNISFALDSMSREIRQGSKIGCQQSYGGSQFTPSSVTSDCESMEPAANQLIVFQTAKTDSTGSCNLYYAYWFSGSAAPYILQKAQQTSCASPQLTQTDFSPIIDDVNVHITGYNLALFSGASFPYKWVFVRLAGYAGVKPADQNSFDIETSISQRVSD